ncbi:MAG TPA: hypothetical protein VKA49_03210 [Flavitalea sp.]|nr:hypothetical protein [Flavitalea sp.]
MMLHISQDRSINEVQQDFNRQYPFLKIEFYQSNSAFTGSSKRQHLINSLPIAKAGLIRSGNIELDDLMTVGQLENIFRTEFGLSAQVSRKSGVLWLETTMTDGWTLRQQNEHGKELSEPVKINNLPNDQD